jgi:hypothetical protein
MMTNMTTHAVRRAQSDQPTCILRWVFHHGSDALTCAIESTGEHASYDVCILPHWNLSVATVEHFDAATSALQRHADIASRLRQAGWVAEYGTSQSIGTAA